MGKGSVSERWDFEQIETWNLFSATKRPLLIAGPCSAESEKQLFQTATELKDRGIEVFRAGIWKPRTRPSSFEGVGNQAFKWTQAIQHELGIKVATEVANAKHVEAVLKGGIDLLWIGTRTTSDPFAVQEICEALKGVDIPVLVKNPLAPDIELWIGALERLSMAGIKKVGAIHRGFFSYTEHRFRNMPEWQIPIELKCRCKDLPLFCDPSHIGGKSAYLQEISQQAMDLGFDGLMIEAHIAPSEALSDAEQQITPTELDTLLSKIVIRGATSDSAYARSLDKLRNEIDKLDYQLLTLLAERMNISRKIGIYKKENNVTILQAGRWIQVLSGIIEKGAGMGLEKKMLEAIFSEIHQASIEVQSKEMEKS